MRGSRNRVARILLFVNRYLNCNSNDVLEDFCEVSAFRTVGRRSSGYNPPMRREPSDILKEALALPVEARAKIANSLLESLDGEVDPGAYEEWEREIQRRIVEVEAGTAKTIPWSEARARLMSHLRNEP